MGVAGSHRGVQQRARTSLLFYLPFVLTLASSCAGQRGNLALDVASIVGGDGVARLNDEVFGEALQDVAAGRYALFLLLDAKDHAQADPDIRADWTNQFSIAAQQYEASRQRSSGSTHNFVLFCIMDYSDSWKAFSDLQVPTVPHILYLSQDDYTGGKSCPIQDTEMSAAGFLQCLEKVSGIRAGGGNTLKDIMRIAGPILIGLGLIFFAVGVYGLIRFLSRTKLKIRSWLVFSCVLAIAVYFVSISGAMFVLIQGVPMVLRNPRSNEMVFFLEGTESQLGAEGFIGGALYTSAGLMLALLTYGVPALPSTWGKRLGGYASMSAFCLCVMFASSLYKWKGGM